MCFADAVRAAGELDAIVIPYERATGVQDTKAVINKLVSDGVRSVGIFIGPEGGFEEDEVQLAAGAHSITLGHRILRTETAGLAALAVLMFAFET